MRVHLGLRAAGEGQVPASAPTTAVQRQSAAAHHCIVMRRVRALIAPGASRLTLTFVIFSALHLLAQGSRLPSSQHKQLYVVCKEQASKLCVTWLIELQNLEDISNELHPWTGTSALCGLSDLRPIPPHRKFISVRPFDGSENTNTIFCKTVNMIIHDAFGLVEMSQGYKSRRNRRQTGHSPRGRYRGQTQSQYLAIDGGSGKDEGKAEAHSAADSSRASVSGNNGMGQAQSQTVYDPSCDECYGRSDTDVANLSRRPIGTGHGSFGPQQTRNDGGGRTPGRDFGGPGTIWDSDSIPNTGSGRNGFGQGVLNGNTIPGQMGAPNKFTSDGNVRPPGNLRQDSNIQGIRPNVPNGGSLTPQQERTGNQYPTDQTGGNGRNVYTGQPDGTYRTDQPGLINQGSRPGSNGLAGPNPLNQIPKTNMVNIQGQDQSPRNTFNQPGGVMSGGGGTGGPGGLGGGGGIGSRGGLGGGGGIGGQDGMSGGGMNGGGGLNGAGGIVGGGGMGGVGGIGGSAGTVGGNGRGGANVPPFNQPINNQGNAKGSLGTNWPLASGPIRGPDGSLYICCVVNPNNLQGGYGIQPYLTGQQTGRPQTPGDVYGTGLPGQTPGGIYGTGTGQAPLGQYGAYGTGVPGQNVPNIPYGTRTTSSQLPGTSHSDGTTGQQIPYETYGGTSHQAPGGTQGTGTDQVGLGAIYGSGGHSQQAPGVFYGPGTSGIQAPGSYYIPGVSGQQTPVGSYGPGTASQQGPDKSYHPGVSSGTFGPGINGQQGPNIPYGSGITGQQTPGAYGTGMTGKQVPDSFGTGVTGQQIPGAYGSGQQTPGSYGTGVTGQQTPGAYGPGVTGQQTPGAYGTGVTGQQTPGAYGTGVTGQQTPGAYGPGVTGQQTPGVYGTGVTGQQTPGAYGTGVTGQQTPGAYGPGVTGQQTPGAYGTGVTGQQTPGAYGTGVTGQPTPGAYGTGVTGQRSPGAFGTGVTGQQSPGSPYGTGITGQSTTGEQQAPGTSGQLPNRSYGTGIGGQPTGSGSYGPEVASHTGPGMSYGPGITGQYVPGASGPGTTGKQGPGGTYGTGTAEQQLPGVSYGRGIAGQPAAGGSYGTENTGQQGISGPYGQGMGIIPGSPYSPGIAGQSTPGGTFGSGGQSGIGRPYDSGSTGQPTSGGSFGQGNNGQQASSGPYETGTTSQQTPGGSYGMGSTGQQPPGGNYGTGTSGPGGAYGTGTGTPNFQGGSYGTGIMGQQKPSVGVTYNTGFNEQNGLQRPDYTGAPQNVLDPNSIITDDDNSQAIASVSQGANGTTASASSNGGNDKGRAQTGVQGTYTGTGSFSAQASISDDNKGAESQVSGSKKGASSNAEGRGRKNKSQAAVKLGSETGSIQTDSQSNGIMHSSNTQVQGSVKGGVADAQAKGPGSTSSQAQIGFTPYKDGDKVHELLKTPFEGGGTASAQSSGRMGTSQSQLRGTFKYGITYNGAAQAGASLDKDAVFSNLLPFEKIDVFDTNNTNINVSIENTEKSPSITSTQETEETNLLSDTKEEETSKDENNYSDHTHEDHHKTNNNNQVNTTNIAPLPGNRRAFPSSYGNNGADYDYNIDDNPPEEYDVDEVPEGTDNVPVDQGEFTNYDNYARESESTHQAQRIQNRKGLEVRQTSGGNTQHILIGSLKNQDARITQIKSERPDEAKVYQPGERIPGMGGYTIPVGFTGSVKSVASKEKTYVIGSKNSPSQAQTVTLTPGTGKVKYVYPDRYGKNVNPKDLRSLYSPKKDDNRYVSVSKSVTRDLDSDNNIRKQYSHTYYTKSSSCGYFTFTCTMVSSAEGKKKVCRPKIPTNPDGTPMRC